MKPKSKKPRTRNAAAKSLRKPQFKQQVIPDKRSKEEIDRRERELNNPANYPPDERCPVPGCSARKTPTQTFCWIHWYDMAPEQRVAIMRARNERNHPELKRLVKEVATWFLKRREAFHKECETPLST